MKPDLSSEVRAVKVKQHRRVEKIVDSILQKREELEIRSEFLRGQRTGEMPYMISRPGTVTEHMNVVDSLGRVSGRNHKGHARPANSQIRERLPGEQGYAEHSSGIPARPAMGGQPARAAVPPKTTFHKALPLRGGKQAKWEMVEAGMHLADAQTHQFLQRPKQPVAPGLMPRRVLNIKRKPR